MICLERWQVIFPIRSLSISSLARFPFVECVPASRKKKILVLGMICRHCKPSFDRIVMLSTKNLITTTWRSTTTPTGQGHPEPENKPAIDEASDEAISHRSSILKVVGYIALMRRGVIFDLRPVPQQTVMVRRSI